MNDKFQLFSIMKKNYKENCLYNNLLKSYKECSYFIIKYYHKRQITNHNGFFKN
jgi:hypothetical protein